MRRKLSTFFATLSLLLLVTVCVLWARSHWLGDYLRWYRAPTIVEVFSNDGLIRVSGGHLVSQNYPPPAGWEGSIWPFDRTVDHYEADLSAGTSFGFGYERSRRQGPGLTADARMITVPYWPLAGLSTATILLIWRSRRRDGRRRTRGECPACGYDLRATPGRCPECGRAAAA